MRNGGGLAWGGLMGGWLPALIVSAVLITPAAATGESTRQDETRRNLEAAERLKLQQSQLGKEAAERAARAASEAAVLGQQRVQAAAKLQEAEANLQAVAARMDALSAKRREAEQRLNDRAAMLRPLLPLIERLSLYPMETLLAVPEDPEGALRGLLVLKGLSRKIEADAEALVRDQADLDAAVKELQGEEPHLIEAQAAQKQQAAALDAQIAAARATQESADAEARAASAQAAQAAAKAETLKAALAALHA